MSPEKAKGGSEDAQSGQGRRDAGASKQQPLLELQRTCQQAYLSWVNDVQQACIKSQARRQEAYLNWIRNLQQQSSTATDINQLTDVYRRSASEFQQSLSEEDFKNEYTEAFRNYLRAIQGSWSQLDPNAIQF